MNTFPETTGDILPPNPIRIETALSRYPIHRLARKGSVAIDIREESKDGEVIARWEVSPNSKYKHPGPLAYKLDTLIINRRIEEANRPVPRIIKLGSLNDICRELGMAESGGNTNQIKKSLHQNASAYITAKIRYRQSNGTEQTLETGFTRYQIVFTGEKLPDRRVADAVYIVLSDAFVEVINGAMTRPLDYDYLKNLNPAPQRFYEMLSYRMYAAIKNDRPRAKLLYSELCTYAPQTRYFDWDHARKQMAKIHRPHRQSGYIGKVDYQHTVDGAGQPDYIMLYQPGPKARAEYRAFAKRGGPVMLEAEPPPTYPHAVAVLQQPALPLAAPKPSPLEAELVGQGITPAIAAGLVRDYDAEKIQTQLDILAWHAEKKPGKISDPAAWLVTAIKNGHALPKGFKTQAQRRQEKEAQEARARKDAEERRQKQEQEASERAEKQMILDRWASLTPKQQAKLQAEADAQAKPEDLAQQTGPLKSWGQTIRRHDYIRQLLQAEGKLPPARE